MSLRRRLDRLAAEVAALKGDRAVADGCCRDCGKPSGPIRSFTVFAVGAEPPADWSKVWPPAVRADQIPQVAECKCDPSRIRVIRFNMLPPRRWEPSAALESP